MQRRNVLMLIGASLAAPFALAAAQKAGACGPEPQFTKQIPFAPGSKEAKIERTIKGDFTHEWIVRGQPGQKVEITLEAKKSGVTMMPDNAGPKDKGPMWGAAPKDGAFVKYWTGEMPKSGRMLIEVSTEESNDTYTLVVKLV